MRFSQEPPVSVAHEAVPLWERMGYMQALRAGLAGIVLVAGIYGSDIVGDTTRRVSIVTFTYLFLVGSAEIMRRLLERVLHHKRITGSSLMLILDGLYLGWVLYATGGSHSPLRFLVYIHLIAVTLLASYRTGLKIALWHSLVFFAMFYLQAASILNPVESTAVSTSTVPFEKISLFNVLAFWLVALGTVACSSINERELRRRKVDLESLAHMAAQLERVTEPTEIASTLLDRVNEIAAFQNGAVLAGTSSDLILLAYRGPAGWAGSYAGKDPLIEQVWNSREPRLIKKLDAKANPGLAALFPSGHNIMVVPLFAEGQPLGAMVLQFGEHRRVGIEKRSIEMILQFGSHAALALGNAWLMERIQIMADTDPLTGVANRRIFEATLERELARAERNGDQVTLVMLDVDHFKKYNDSFGHQSGDKVLQGVARVLVETSREFDTVARYGGEEFAVVIPSCNFKDSLISGDRLRKVIGGLQGESAISASAGLATFPVNATDVRGLIRAADEALYEAKRAGRDRVMRSRRKPVPAEEVAKVEKVGKVVAEPPVVDLTAPDLAVGPVHLRKQSETRLSYLMENSSEIILVVTAEGVVRYQSPSVARVLGYEPGELVGSQFERLVHPNETARARSLAGAHSKDDRTEWTLAKRNGEWMQVEASVKDMTNDDRVSGIVFTARDITERKRLESKLEQQALLDPMTGLANRMLFLNHVDHALTDTRAKKLSVLLLDIDDFKAVNELMGNAAGDELLVQVAARLRNVVKGSDVAARFSGDEFAVLVEGVGSARGIRQVACRVMDAMKQPFSVGGRTLTVHLSIGAAIRNGDTAHELIRNAEVAMHAAKTGGKKCCEVYDPAKHEGVLRRLELKAELQQAVDRNEFVVHYQPLVRLDDNSIAGFEALVRWNHPAHGLVLPGEFIPAAEENGLVMAIGRKVLDDACRQASQWHKSHPADDPIRISVNLSTRQLADPGLVNDVSAALKASGLDPNLLILEVTESVLMHDIDRSAASLRDLKQLGVRLAIDDFGTGYSSLMYLRRLPIDILKIAKPFVDELSTNSKGAALAVKILELAAMMGMETIAEGIELPEQLKELRRLQCDLGQGYYFARSLEPTEAARLLTTAAAGPDSWRINDEFRVTVS